MAIVQLLDFDQRKLHAALRKDFPLFIGKVAKSLAPDHPFLMNWHIEALAWHMELIRMGKLRRLIINMPPRSLKSIVASVAFPAFSLGHDPSRRIICITYGNDLSIKFANDCRAIINSPWYRAVFRDMRLSKIKNTETEIVTTRGGFRLATSVGGTLTGRGGDLVIVDDPLKPSDALSDAKREFTNQWFQNTLFSRLDDKRTGAMVIVMQRLHMDDLAGVLTRASDDWTVLNLGAIAETDESILISDTETHLRMAGEALHPEREPLAVLNKIKADIGSDTFSAQYQQSPVPPGGAMIKKAWIKWFKTLPPRTYTTRVLQSWDTAQKEGPQNDWSVCTTVQIEDGKFYFFDLFRKRMDYPTLKTQALRLAALHGPTEIIVEDCGVGTALVQELQKMGITIIPNKPERDKVARMAVHSAKFEAGQVYLPEQASWLPDLLAELHAFPYVRYDDQVDSISQALSQDKPPFDYRYVR